ncbi:MAG: OmpA family protein [Candidatus Acidiferrales bacterium]|jgi:outer membrane protein OmpA-like peptidoglycan-associated protein
MRKRRFWLAAALAASVSLAAQTKYADADSSAVQAAARAALPHAKVADIVGVTREIQGVTSGIQSVLQDLGAKVTAQEVKIELDADVLFDFDKYNLKPEAAESLKKVGQVVQSYPNAPLLIEGHTDGVGTHAHNMKLSDDRAASVKTWLVQNAGIQGSRITTRGWGETKPLAPNKNPNGSDNPAGRQKNRRVEITLRTS